MTEPGRWDSLFGDLEAQLAAELAQDFAAEVDARTRGEVADLTIADRLRAAVGEPLQFSLCGGFRHAGTLARVGPGWLLLEAGAREVLVPSAAVVTVRGLGRQARAEADASPVTARLGLRHALRGVARDRARVQVQLADAIVVDATLDRVGADFIEVAVHAVDEQRRRGAVRQVELIALAHVAAVVRQPG